MPHEKWQEDFSQIRKLIHTTKEQLPRGKTTAVPPSVTDSQLCLHCEGTIAKGGTGTK